MVFVGACVLPHLCFLWYAYPNHLKLYALIILLFVAACDPSSTTITEACEITSDFYISSLHIAVGGGINVIGNYTLFVNGSLYSGIDPNEQGNAAFFDCTGNSATYTLKPPYAQFISF
jgi:hypothetical protein